MIPFGVLPLIGRLVSFLLVSPGSNLFITAFQKARNIVSKVGELSIVLG